jgi:hypothetical protein
MNTQLKNYLELQSKFKRMEDTVDTWAIDYALEKLAPLVQDGFDYDDITNFILARWDLFVHGGKLDELLETYKRELKEETKTK